MARRAFTPVEDAQVREMRAQGMRIAAIGAALGRSTLSVQKRMHYLRVRLPRPARVGGAHRRWKADDDALVRQLRDSGLSHQEIGERVTRSTAAVKERLKIIDRSSAATAATLAQPVATRPQKTMWQRQCLQCGVAFTAPSPFLRLCPNHRGQC